jgi:chromosome segregation ATPase
MDPDASPQAAAMQAFNDLRRRLSATSREIQSIAESSYGSHQQFSAQLTKQQDANTALTQRLAEANEVVERLKAELTTCEEKRKQDSTLLHEKDKTIARLEAKVEGLERTLAYDGKTREVDFLHNRLKVYDSDFQKMDCVMKKLRSDNTAMSTELERLKNHEPPLQADATQAGQASSASAESECSTSSKKQRT